MAKEKVKSKAASEKTEAPAVKITSNEITVISSEYINMVGASVVFEKNIPVFLTQEAFDELCAIPNFKSLVDKGVVKLGM